jgi:acetylornithine deacetylase/succinyl-diaminopimelate desuccinylase-like protein
MDFERIKQAAADCAPAMNRFLRELIAIPSESCEEEGVIRRCAAEMEKLGYDRVEIDPMGNCLGWMGTGSRILAFDGHIDNVGVGNRNN